MKVDQAPCWHCRTMFEPWTNERYCSDRCHDLAEKAKQGETNMIGNGYWSNGITVSYHDGRWGAHVDYYDNGFATNSANGPVSTEGTLRTRYHLRSGEEADALTVAIDTVKADAERLGITWAAPGIGPFVYMKGDGENGGIPAPADWRDLVTAQARRLGWERLYSTEEARG